MLCSLKQSHACSEWSGLGSVGKVVLEFGLEALSILLKMGLSTEDFSQFLMSRVGIIEEDREEKSCKCEVCNSP